MKRNRLQRAAQIVRVGCAYPADTATSYNVNMRTEIGTVFLIEGIGHREAESLRLAIASVMERFAEAEIRKEGRK